MDLEFELEALQMLPEEQGLTGSPVPCILLPLTSGLSCGGLSCGATTCANGYTCDETCSYGTAMQ